MKIKKIISNENFYISLCALGSLDFLSYSLPTVYYPALADARGMDAFDIAVVFTLFTIGKFFGAFYSASIMPLFSQKCLLIIILIFNNIGKFTFGVIEFFNNETIFMFVSIISRIIIGFSTGLLMSVLYSTISKTWPDELMKRISIFEILQVMSAGAGPVLASWLYSYGGFFIVFAIFSLVTLSTSLLLVWRCIPEIIPEKVNTEKRKSISIIKALFTLRILVLVLFQAAIYSSLLIIISQYELHIIDFGGTPTTASLLFSLDMVGYVFALILIAKLHKSGKNAIFMVIGSIFNVGSLFFQGPDPIFGIQDSLTKFILIGLGITFSGFGEGLSLLVLVSEYINELNQRFLDQPQLCNDLSGGLFSIGYTLGEFSGQMVGGVLMEYFGYYYSIRYYAFALIVYLAFFCFVMKYKKPNYFHFDEN